MRALVAEAYGAPDSFVLRSIAATPPASGEVRVAVQAAGVSFVDRLIAAGSYQLRPSLPYILGTEFAGVVQAVGDGVSRFAPGDRVGGSALGGGMAETLTVAADRLYHLPASMDVATGAIFRVPYTTAYHALVQRGAVRTGERILILGAGGAVGHAAVQIVVALGGVAIAAASTPAKRAAAIAAGATEVIDPSQPDWRNAVRASGPVDLVVDPVGGALTESAFRCLGWGGRHLVIGFVAGQAALPTNLPLLKGAALVGVDIRQFSEREPALYARNLADLVAMHDEGKLRPLIRARYTLSDFAAAMAALDDPVPGRIVIDITR